MTLPDSVTIHPAAGPLRGVLSVPGDKSVSHRAFILGALCGAPVEITGAAASGDVLSTIGALRSMGVTVEGAPANATVTGPLREPADVLDCGNSGTAMRLLAGVCAGIDGVSVLTGDTSLRSRPMDRIAVPLRSMGARVDGRAGGRLAPLVVRGGRLRGLDHDLPVASAQVKSCLLLAGLSADGVTSVSEPGPSRDHTERMLRWLGAHVETAGRRVGVHPGELRARPLRVPGDPSSAAFWFVAAAGVPGSEVTVRNVCVNPTRTGALDVLGAAGAGVDVAAADEWSGEPVGNVTVRARPSEQMVLEGDDVVRAIDEVPALAVAGAVGGGLVVRDAAELRVKESDRIEGVARVLTGLRAKVETSADGLAVSGGQSFGGGEVDSGGDHRLAMCAAVAALSADAPVTVHGFRCVATSYPSFLEDLSRVGARWEPAR